jgi:hypothetical protein
VFRDGDGADIITDFELGTDRIELQVTGSTFAGLQIVNASRAITHEFLTGQYSGAEITYGTGQSIFLVGIDAAQLSASDFEFTSQTNALPELTDDATTVATGSSVLIDVLANDSDPDEDTLSLVSVIGASDGTAILEGGEVRYTPHAGFVGQDTLTYEVSDGQGGSSTAQINVTVEETPQSNTAPTAIADTVSVVEEAPLVFDVLGNDSDPDGDVLTVTEVNGLAIGIGAPVALASGASVELQADGQLLFVQNGAFTTLSDSETAVETFSYRVEDGNGGFAIETVQVTIQGSGIPPAF